MGRWRWGGGRKMEKEVEKENASHSSGEVVRENTRVRGAGQTRGGKIKFSRESSLEALAKSFLLCRLLSKGRSRAPGWTDGATSKFIANIGANRPFKFRIWWTLIFAIAFFYVIKEEFSRFNFLNERKFLFHFLLFVNLSNIYCGSCFTWSNFITCSLEGV